MLTNLNLCPGIGAHCGLKYHAGLGLLAGFAMMAAWLASPRPSFSQNEGNFLPATTGEPLTIAPVDMQDIDCIVAQWRPAPARPVLTLICPPNTVFAPLRVLIKLSWMKPEASRIDAQGILALEGSPTKIRTDKTAVLVWLPVAQQHENAGRKPHAAWVAFDAVVDVALYGRHK